MSRAPERYPSPIAALKQGRSWLLRASGRGYLRLGGWRFEGEFPAEPKCVLILAPHTSSWDFLLGIAILLALDLRVSWLGKSQLFRAPFKGLLGRLGGIAVHRDGSHGLVDQCVQAFEAAPALMLALAPEGTRKGPSRWRSGFYHVATRAGVPIFPVGFDFGEHVVRLMPVFRPTGSFEEDIKRLRGRFSDVRGLNSRPTA